MRKKSNPCLYDAVKIAFDGCPQQFTLLRLVTLVRIITDRHNVTDGSISRRLREQRQDGNINYRCINRESAMYEKLEVKQ